MDIAPVLDGFTVVLEPTNLLYCLIGVVIGMLIGVLPGLGPAATIAILLPLTFGIEPVTAIIMLAGIFYGAQYGGTITSVLLKLPGEASSVVTVFDGHALARQGKAGTALGIAAIPSAVPALPCRARAWPSNTVTTDEASPGSLSSTEVMVPPYWAP